MWQVCAKPCSQEAKHCDELDAWSLRLDTELIANKAFVESVQPSESPQRPALCMHDTPAWFHSGCLLVTPS